ncbi:MAG: hypothetical protein KAT88_10000 [Spirochaetes bacterium]|nr:hypothetical protein [Spirochaetota bacterium]
MIQIAHSILSATCGKLEEAVGMRRSAIFDEENSRDTIFEGIILRRKFGQS